MPTHKQFVISRPSEFKARLAQWNTDARTKFGTGYKWLCFVGDVANMYDELNHSEVNSATAWAMDKAAEWTGVRGCRSTGITISSTDIKIGVNYNSEEGTFIPFPLLQRICEFDNSNCVLAFKGFLYRRLLGCPMGGFLSPHKANLTLAKREFVFCDIMESLGVVGG